MSSPFAFALIVVSNDQLLQMSGNVPVNDAFKEADNVLKEFKIYRSAYQFCLPGYS